MRAIPTKMRKEMDADPFYQRCCVTGKIGKIEWHHHLIFAGRQVNEKFCILPLLEAVHDRIHEQAINEWVTWIMLNRATTDQLIQYGKAVNLTWRKMQFNKVMGVWKEGLYVEIDDIN